MTVDKAVDDGVDAATIKVSVASIWSDTVGIL